MDLTRLQAGQELRDVKPIDVAVLLRELLENLQPQAVARGLFLNADGAETLIVDADAIKVRRIAQNLLLNALKYTQAGGVTMGWGDSRNNDAKRWMLWVKDTGPGFHAGPGAPLAAALEDATAESKQVDEHVSQGPRKSKDPLRTGGPCIRSQARASAFRLSNDFASCWTPASNSNPNREWAPLFRVIFPRHYDAAAKNPRPVR